MNYYIKIKNKIENKKKFFEFLLKTTSAIPAHNRTMKFKHGFQVTKVRLVIKNAKLKETQKSPNFLNIWLRNTKIVCFFDLSAK